MATTAHNILDQDLVRPEAGEDSDDSRSDLTPRQHQVIALLSEGQSVSAAARAAGIHRTTIHHWRRTDPSFALALRDSERDTAQHYRCATQARAEKALTALDGLLDNERTPATVRLKAVLHVLQTATTIPPSVDSFEQDLLTRERQKLKRQQDREIDQIMADAETLHNMSFEQYQAMLYEGETDDERSARLNRHKNVAELDSEEDRDSIPAIHHNSSLFGEFQPVEQPAKLKTVVYATPRPGRNQPCPCHSGRKYKHCCLNEQKQEGAPRPNGPSAPSS